MKKKIIKFESGQSLIETVVAIFVLVIGISGALGLATYSFGSTTNVTKQIIGTGLAREGLEAVKNMRDTNWLKGSPSTDCWNFTKSDNSATCYKTWLEKFYNIKPGTNAYGLAVKIYKLDINKSAVGSSDQFWNLIPDDGALQAKGNFALDRDPQAYVTPASGIAQGKFYYPAASSVGTSDFYRRITITSDNMKQPFSDGNENATTYYWPKVTVDSDVWWKDKNCPAVNTWEQANVSCRIRLRMDLTNWRVY